jgi:alpha-glucosidase (family GH31 glycosyl hydrolase)
MPWTYGARGVALMRRYFTLHTELIPYLYTYAWQAHRHAVPILRPLYLEGVHGAQAYRHPHEYFFGADLLVAPVLSASGERSVYLPPGQWIDFFTGKHYAGGKTYTAHYGVADTPVFVRAGAVIPEQQPSAYSNAKPLDPLVLQVYGSGVGRFDLYQDDGSSFDYRSGQYALTPIDYHTRNGRHRLVIGPTRGKYRGQLATRGYALSLHTRHRPTALTVDGTPVQTVSWDGAHRIARVRIPAQSIRQVVVVTWR